MDMLDIDVDDDDEVIAAVVDEWNRDEVDEFEG